MTKQPPSNSSVHAGTASVNLGKVGSTVVLPSDFQSETTCNPLYKAAADNSPRGHSRTGARAINPAEINVLIACEESQVECKAFRALGFNAFSCDIQRCFGGHPEWHIHGDVSPYLKGCVQFTTSDGLQHTVSHWHLIIAHPPCTYLSKVGSQHLVRHLHELRRVSDLPDGWFIETHVPGSITIVNSDRLERMNQARQFFQMCLDAKCDFLAVENPIPQARANLPKPTTYVEPWWYGHPWSKKTLLWLRNLPPLMPGCSETHFRCHCSSHRGKYRSRSFTGIANAMAQQWGSYILQQLTSA